MNIDHNEIMSEIKRRSEERIALKNRRKKLVLSIVPLVVICIAAAVYVPKIPGVNNVLDHSRSSEEITATVADTAEDSMSFASSGMNSEESAAAYESSENSKDTQSSACTAPQKSEITDKAQKGSNTDGIIEGKRKILSVSVFEKEENQYSARKYTDAQTVDFGAGVCFSGLRNPGETPINPEKKLSAEEYERLYVKLYYDNGEEDIFTVFFAGEKVYVNGTERVIVTDNGPVSSEEAEETLFKLAAGEEK